ncbi:MAG: class I SAM-dependent methyltransferase [Methanobacterium sp.]
MSLFNEKDTYNRAQVSNKTCEIETFDKVIFPNLIRKRELEIIFKLLDDVKPENILDYGCGGGWLSKILISKGYNVTGIDISDKLIENAQKQMPEGKFYAGDCCKMPFKDDEFDLIIGFAILHHLDLNKALLECKRVSTNDAQLLFIEPNRFNPISAIGNRLSVLDTHTEDEAPFNPIKYKDTLKKFFNIEKIFYLFPYSFGAAYLSMRLNSKNNGSLNSLLPFIEISEKIYERIPILNLTCSQIAVILKKQ